MKKVIDKVDLKGKKVLLRVDFNVPVSDKGEVTDDKRIVAALPTIKYLLGQNCKLILVSHLGRPEGVDVSLSLKPAANKLSEYIKNEVIMAHDVVGNDAVKKAQNLKEGQVLVLENVRFEQGEEENDEVLAKKLADMAEFFVNDAFGTAHRKHASTYGVAKLLPNALGFLMGKETNLITCAMKNPDRPFVAVMGGSKVSDKIAMLNNLVKIADTVIVGGAMAYSFLKAKGNVVGTSKTDEESVEKAKEILDYANSLGKKILLPVDSVCAKSIDDNKVKVFKNEKFPCDYMGLDIGPKSAKIFAKCIKSAHTVIWNGPMGVFEKPKFANGTKKVAIALSKVQGISIIGGGDSASAAKMFNIKDKVTHVSTGGGASLKLLEGNGLPCVDVIEDEVE